MFNIFFCFYRLLYERQHYYPHKTKCRFLGGRSVEWADPRVMKRVKRHLNDPLICWVNTKDPQLLHMCVSKNRGTPKWMVYKGNPVLRVTLFLETPICSVETLYLHDTLLSGLRHLIPPGFEMFLGPKMPVKKVKIFPVQDHNQHPHIYCNWF